MKLKAFPGLRSTLMHPQAKLEAQMFPRLLAPSIFASVKRIGLAGFRNKIKPTELCKMFESKDTGLLRLLGKVCEYASTLASEQQQQHVVWM